MHTSFGACFPLVIALMFAFPLFCQDRMGWGRGKVMVGYKYEEWNVYSLMRNMTFPRPCSSSGAILCIASDYLHDQGQARSVGTYNTSTL